MGGAQESIFFFFLILEKHVHIVNYLSEIIQIWNKYQ